MPAIASKHPLAIIALSGATVALALHLLAVFEATPFGMGFMFLVFPVGILCFGALMISVNGRARLTGNTRASVFDLLTPLPAWARALFGAVFLYAGLNFVLFFQATGGGTLERASNGSFVLSDHGRVIRTLDEQGVRAFHAWEMRLFSGHILPFLVLPGLYFLFAPRARETNESRISPAP